MLQIEFILLITITTFTITVCVDLGPALHQITSTSLVLGECPTWDSRNNRLYYVDIVNGDLFIWNYDSNETSVIHFEGTVAGVIPSKADPDLIVIGVNRSITAIQLDSDAKLKTTKDLGTVSEDVPDSRLNEGKADREGRLWFGTIGNNDVLNKGFLYKISSDNIERIMKVDVGNGCVWNKANDKFFYIDSNTFKVIQYDFDSTSGNISNPKTAFDLKKYNLSVFPDGMTIDTDDFLYVALFGGGRVVKVDPANGNIVKSLAVPATYVTSVVWGGPNLDILFVTTAKRDLKTEEIQNRESAAGNVFAFTNLGAKGFKMFETNIVNSI